MAVTIERELGRPSLVVTLADAREFVACYNKAAVNENAKNGGPACGIVGGFAGAILDG